MRTLGHVTAVPYPLEQHCQSWHALAWPFRNLRAEISSALLETFCSV